MSHALRATIRLFMLLSLTFFVLGCSKTPVPSSHPYSLQKQMQAANHWRVIAKDIGDDVSSLVGSDIFITSPIKITTNDNSSFSQAFRSFLATELVNYGVRLTTTSNPGYELFWSVQQVYHKASRSHTKYPFGSYVGMSALGYGAYKLWTDSTRFARFLTVGVGTEAAVRSTYPWATRTPHNEIIININIQKDNEIVYRFSNIYYIKDLDTSQYFFARDNFDVDRNVQTRTVNVKSIE